MPCNFKCYPFCPDSSATGKKKEIGDIIRAGSRAVYHVLTNPKNIQKEPFSHDLVSLVNAADAELVETEDEIFEKTAVNYQAARLEAADTIAYLCAIIAECDRRIADEETNR